MQHDTKELIASLDAQVQNERRQREAQQEEANRRHNERLAEEARHVRRHRLVNLVVSKRPAEGEESVTFHVPSAGCCGSRCRGFLADRSSRWAAIILHPWGVLGGDMFNPNVVGCLLACADAGLTTLRFNFRCTLGNGRAAAADLRGACAFMRSLDSPPERVVVIGYSYGGMVAADVCPDLEDVGAFAMVAPPLGVAKILFSGRDAQSVTSRAQLCLSKPRLALLGTHDPFCSLARFQEFTDGLVGDNATHAVLYGPQKEGGGCGHQGCGHNHNIEIHHHNVFEVLDEHLPAWLASFVAEP